MLRAQKGKKHLKFFNTNTTLQSNKIVLSLPSKTNSGGWYHAILFSYHIMPNHIMSYYHAIYHAMLYFAINHATTLMAGMAWCKEQILVDKAIIKVAHAASPRCFAKLSDKICNKMQISNMLSLKTSSLPFKSCQLVAFIVKCNIIMFLWLPLTLNLTIWMCVMRKCMAAMRCHNIHLNFQVSFPHNWSKI